MIKQLTSKEHLIAALDLKKRGIPADEYFKGLEVEILSKSIEITCKGYTAGFYFDDDGKMVDFYVYY